MATCTKALQSSLRPLGQQWPCWSWNVYPNPFILDRVHGPASAGVCVPAVSGQLTAGGSTEDEFLLYHRATRYGVRFRKLRTTDESEPQVSRVRISGALWENNRRQKRKFPNTETTQGLRLAKHTNCSCRPPPLLLHELNQFCSTFQFQFPEKAGLSGWNTFV